MANATYIVKQTSFSFAGYDINGFAPDTHIEAEFNEDHSTPVVGNDGTTARALNANHSGTVRLRLLATSPSNQTLSALANKDKIDGSGVGPILIKDNSGESLAAGTGAFILKAPMLSLGSEVAVNEWTFYVGDLLIYHAGNP